MIIFSEYRFFYFLRSDAFVTCQKFYVHAFRAFLGLIIVIIPSDISFDRNYFRNMGVDDRAQDLIILFIHANCCKISIKLILRYRIFCGLAAYIFRLIAKTISSCLTGYIKSFRRDRLTVPVKG